MSAPRVRRRRGAPGFTLLELLVALGVLLLATVMIGGMLDEARILAGEAGRDLVAPDAAIALARLRRDLRGAASARGGLFATGSPLVLEGHPAGRIVYQRVGRRLERSLTEAGGGGTFTATVLEGVAAWSWSETAPGLVEIELAVRLPGRGRGRAWQAAQSRLESHRLAVVLRGAGRGRSW
jgi:prepilin-type N-terminal cleavage/methylation domain-containing protein